jgi:chromosome segregation ATPase
MGKQVLQKAGLAAVESALRDLQPFLGERFKLIDERFAMMDERFKQLHREIERLANKMDDVDRRLDARIDSLREEMVDRFENQLGTIKEVSHRITKLDGHVEGFMELFGKMFEPVRLPTKRRKAG